MEFIASFDRMIPFGRNGQTLLPLLIVVNERNFCGIFLLEGNLLLIFDSKIKIVSLPKKRKRKRELYAKREMKLGMKRRRREERKEKRGKRRSRPTGSLAALQFIAGDLGGIASASKSSISPPNNGSVVLLAIYPKRINSKRAVNIPPWMGPVQRGETREREFSLITVEKSKVRAVCTRIPGRIR